MLLRGKCMGLIRISESDDWFVDYDKERGMYRVSYFEDNHFKDECWFDCYEEKELGVIFPQTIGDITFYSKAELFEWVENMQKEFCSPPTGFLGCKVDKPIKIVFEGDIKVEGDDNNIEVTKRLSKMEAERLLLNTFGTTDVGVLDCSDKTEEEIDKIINEFNDIGCTSFRLTADELKEIVEKEYEAN